MGRRRIAAAPAAGDTGVPLRHGDFARGHGEAARNVDQGDRPFSLMARLFRRRRAHQKTPGRYDGHVGAVDAIAHIIADHVVGGGLSCRCGGDLDASSLRLRNRVSALFAGGL